MEFFIYLSKSATILFLFYLVYVIVLRKDTFFTANRFYLLSGIVAALWFPLLTFTQTVYVEIPPFIPEAYTTIQTGQALETTTASAPPFNWWYVATMGYLIGVIYMLGQFVFRLNSLIQLLRKYPSKRHNGFVFVRVEDATTPFSFFNYIVYNPQFHSEEELQMILQHEQVHAAQWHSLDVLAAHVLRAIHWLNPISWWYKKSLEANLEFIADDQTAQHVSSKEAYQLALVKASSALQTPVLTTNFYQSFIKKRIIMLNKDHSNKYNRLKLSLIIPVLGLFLWSFNTNEVVAYIETASLEETTATSFVPLTFSAETTNTELDEIENYLGVNHSGSLVKIANRKRNVQGDLVKFSFKTKFQGHNRFYTRFDRQTDKPFRTTYEILPQEDGSLIVNELGENGVQLLISKEKLKINSLVELNGDAISEPTLVLNKLEKVELEEINTNMTSQGTVLNTKTNSFANVNNASIKRIQFPITKNTTDAQLDTYVAEAKSKYGYELSFTVNRNSSQEITGLKIAYDGEGNSGNISSSNGGPIPNSYFYIDDETGGAGFMNEGSEERMIEMRERMEVRRAQMEGRRAQMEGRRGERKALLEESKTLRRRLLTDSVSGRAQLFEERREEQRERMHEMRERQHLLHDSVAITEYRHNRLFSNEEEHEYELEEHEEHERTNPSQNIVREYANVHTNTNGSNNFAHVNNDEHAIRITKNTSDSELSEMKSYLAKKGIKFSYKRVKRNSKGQITSLKLNIDNGKGSKITKSISSDDGEPIDSIYMKI